jgi:hypothetical protein
LFANIIHPTVAFQGFFLVAFCVIRYVPLHHLLCVFFPFHAFPTMDRSSSPWMAVAVCRSPQMLHKGELRLLLLHPQDTTESCGRRHQRPLVLQTTLIKVPTLGINHHNHEQLIKSRPNGMHYPRRQAEVFVRLQLCQTCLLVVLVRICRGVHSLFQTQYQ